MMLCTKEVQEKCPFSIMCGGPCKVADDSECADFITKVLTGQDAAPVEVPPEEAAYLQQERQAIQEEGARQLETQVPKWNSANNPPKRWRENDKDKTLVNYLVYSPDYGVDVGNWIETAKLWVIMGLPARVTHWMPMPEPPKEDAKK